MNENLKENKKQLRKVILYACIIDKNNSSKIKRLNASENTFKYKNKRYNIIINKNIMTMRLKGLFKNKYYIFYYVDNSEPLLIENEKLRSEKFNPEIYNAIIETNIIKKANNINNFSLDNIEPKYIILGLIVIGAVIYFMSGGTLT